MEASDFNTNSHDSNEEEHSVDVDAVSTDEIADDVARWIQEEENVGKGKKSGNACARPTKKLRSLQDISAPQATTKGGASSSKRKASTNLDKGKNVVSSSKANKTDTTTGSKLMASAIRAGAAASEKSKNNAMVLVCPINVSQTGSASVQVDTSEDNDEEEKKPKGKKTTSWVWDHMDKFDKEVTLEDGTVIIQKWAKCHYCRHTACAKSKNGTSALANHLVNIHKQAKGQQLLTKEVKVYKYDEQASVRMFYECLVMHEYPFHMCQHAYFIRFIKSLRPTFPFKSRITVRKEIMSIYKEEKSKLYAQFKKLPYRFSFTMDMWTSIQNKAYMCVTAHWIDDDWKMQKRIINFMHVESNHSGIKLSDTFYKNVLDWNLDKKMFALSLDNASSNKVVVDQIVDNAKGILILGGKFFHVRCANHILNLVARDGLNLIECAIGNIREFISIIKRSPQQWEAFQKCAQECDLDTSRALSLDVATRWNSTYIMIRDALYYKDACDRIALKDGARYDHLKPTTAEWLNASQISKCLKKFYDVTVLFSGTSYPTANLFFRKFCEIKIAITKWCDSNDIIVSNLGESMQDKFDKYWEMSNLALFVAAFLDPRYKDKVIHLYLSIIYGGDLAELEKLEFMNMINELFAQYSCMYISSINPTSTSKDHGLPSIPKVGSLDDDDDEIDIGVLYHSTSNERNKSELEVYMNEPLLIYNDSDGIFDVLSWWKGQMTTYPILSRLARDVLSIQVSTVASESAFSAGGRVIDPFRGRLDAKIVEALVCTKDWLIASHKDDMKNAILEGICDKMNELEIDENEEMEEK